LTYQLIIREIARPDHIAIQSGLEFDIAMKRIGELLCNNAWELVSLIADPLKEN